MRRNLSQPFVLLPFRFVDFGRRSEEDFTRIHQCFTQRRMWMNCIGDVMQMATHFNRKYGFGNKFPGTRTDNSAANDLFRIRIDQPFR